MKKGIDILQEVIQERLEEKRRKEAMSQTQYCPKCKTDKPADTDHFYNDSKSKTSLSCWCKDCQRAALRKRNSKKKKDKTAANLKVNVTRKTKPAPAKKDMVLTLDFSENEILYEDILAEANDQLRTPAMQAMWLASQSLYKERSQTNGCD